MPLNSYVRGVNGAVFDIATFRATGAYVSEVGAGGQESAVIVDYIDSTHITVNLYGTWTSARIYYR